MNEYRGIKIVYEDNHLLVVIKPANMPSQGDISGDPDILTLLKAYIKEKYDKKGAVFLGLIHRLDRPVAGLMVFARTSKAAQRLSAQVREKSLARGYIACVRGDALPHALLCDHLLKDQRTNIVRVVGEGTDGAKHAQLAYWACGKSGDLSLVRVKLYTGRSHQIRVQMANAGLPLWGDAKYGAGKPGQPIALFGAFLNLQHPTTRERLCFHALPDGSVMPFDQFTLPDAFGELDGE